MDKRWLRARRDAWIDALLARTAVPMLLVVRALLAILPPLITASVTGSIVLAWVSHSNGNCYDILNLNGAEQPLRRQATWRSTRVRPRAVRPPGQAICVRLA